MQFQSRFKNLLEQEVSRKQFLLMVVLLLMTTIGIERFFKIIDVPKREVGFGTGPYGGTKS